MTPRGLRHWINQPNITRIGPACPFLPHAACGAALLLSATQFWHLYNPNLCEWRWEMFLFARGKRENSFWGHLGIHRKHENVWALHPTYPTGFKGEGLRVPPSYSLSCGQRSRALIRAVSPCDDLRLLHKLIPCGPSLLGLIHTKFSLKSGPDWKIWSPACMCIRSPNKSLLTLLFNFPSNQALAS